MEIFVVTSTSWNGEMNVTRVHKLFLSEELATEYVEKMNDLAGTSAYATTYEVESMEAEN